MTLDPGLQGTGMAVWRKRTLVEAQVLTVPNRLRKADWWDRVFWMTETLREWMVYHEVGSVVAEMTEYHAAAHRVMAWKTGDLQRLTFLVGAIGQTCQSLDIQFLPIETSKWKGQLSKEMTIQRVKEALGEAECRQKKITTHAWDAVGIGLWHLRGGI